MNNYYLGDDVTILVIGKSFIPKRHKYVTVSLCSFYFFLSGNYVKRQTETWTKQYRASQTDEIAAMEQLIEWLPKNIPSTEKTTVVHGDFR